MIEKVRIRGYRKLRAVDVVPHEHLNVLVGENEAGKSTFIEALVLALTGRINGRPAQEELNPYWFNQDGVSEFFERRSKGEKPAPPEISIELFLADRPELVRRFFGAHNSDVPTNSCAGVVLEVVPDEQFRDELEAYFGESSELSILPVEYYQVRWRTFGDIILTSKPKELTTSIIDSSTVRSTSGVDYHLRQVLSDHIDADEKARISLAYRLVKAKMTTDHLAVVNQKMESLEGTFSGKALALAMDQTSRNSWDSSVSPHIAELPFSMFGHGQQAAVKIALAVARHANSASAVMIEEPENHQSHTHLHQLIDRIHDLSGENQQIFVTTHSSYVLNRLGLDNLLILSNGRISSFLELDTDTVKYFQKLPGHDTLRMVLADKLVLVEGPSDEILFDRFYLDRRGKHPLQAGIDVISMRGLAVKRCLELSRSLGKPCTVLRDNDGVAPEVIRLDLGDLLSDNRKVFIGEVSAGETLEPQLRNANGETRLRTILGIRSNADLSIWMKNNKTEGALRIAESHEPVNPPRYFVEAIDHVDSL